jgi:hypothetical protein
MPCEKEARNESPEDVHGESRKFKVRYSISILVGITHNCGRRLVAFHSMFARFKAPRSCATQGTRAKGINTLPMVENDVFIAKSLLWVCGLCLPCLPCPVFPAFPPETRQIDKMELNV